jgi:simple sugar transport system permease protein
MSGDKPKPVPFSRPACWARGLADAFRRHPTLWPFTAMIVLLAWNIFFTPNFIDFEVHEGRLFGSIVSILQKGAPVMLLAIGMTLVIGLGGIDISVGSVMAMAGTVTALLIVGQGLPAPVAVLAGLGVALLAGAWNGALVTFVGLQPIIATLVLLMGGRGIAQALTGDQNVPFTSPAMEYLSTRSFLYLPIPIFIVLGVAVVVLLALHKTVLGLYIEAIGGNAKAARLAGLPVHGVRLLVYAFCGLCAGLAGVINTADIQRADVANCGLYLELDAILAVVIGGTSFAGGRPYLVGAIFGAIIMRMLTTMLLMHNVPTEKTLIVKAVVAIAVCLIQTPAFASVMGRLRLGRARQA